MNALAQVVWSISCRSAETSPLSPSPELNAPESNSALLGANAQPLDSIVKNSFLNLIRYAESNLPQESRNSLFQGILEALEEALLSGKEATDLIRAIEESVEAIDCRLTETQQEEFLHSQLGELPEEGDLVLNLRGINRISSAVIARCLTARRLLADRGNRLILADVNLNLRDTLETVQFDRLFEIRYAGAPVFTSASVDRSWHIEEISA